MSRSKKVPAPGKSTPISPRPNTPEGRETQVIAIAYDLAEKQIREGTASSQVITHFLKMGAQRERLEREILEAQYKLVLAKTDAIEEEKRNNIDYQEVIRALRRYNGDFSDEN